ncbi:MAG TPA: enoyl-CoA hydratase-related protein [Acidimicrobiales bacterium]|nr:enoyl-CoA hydratase-related protein [Acidimicrobiales bacterium]
MPDLIVERADGVVRATLNRPERKNALTYQMFDELATLFAEVDATGSDRALVLRGLPGAFSSGMDLSDRGAPGAPALGSKEAMDRIHLAALGLHRLSKPSIAAVDGLAAGAGMSLAIGCDLVLASTRARFSAIFVRRGLSVDFGGTWLLPRLVGMGKAKELALLGEFIDADEALRIGLVSRVVNPDELDHAVDFVVNRLATGPTVALRSDLELLQSSLQRTFEEQIAAESAAQVANLRTEDAAEAIAAFLEKRDAQFRGR